MGLRCCHRSPCLRLRLPKGWRLSTLSSVVGRAECTQQSASGQLGARDFGATREQGAGLLVWDWAAGVTLSVSVSVPGQGDEQP